jgi:formate hydrogenlyase subunit 3/multisubunit Na+/H+ antiporter MnhD subunit
MSLLALLAWPALPALLALVAALLLLVPDVRRRAWHVALGLPLVLVPCAVVLMRGGAAGGAAPPLIAALIAAALAQRSRDPLPSECALKLVWVLGGAFALTGVGLALMALATGVTPAPEQWSVLQLGLTQRLAWSVALPLVLLAGVVLLGGAPFHFWMADLFQGAPAALAPLAAAALQAMGAAWLAQRLDGIGAFGEGVALAGTLLRTASAAALLAGAGTILWQRGPERRVGTLASLQGGLALAALAGALGRGAPREAAVVWLLPWAAHLALALSGAALLARLQPVDRSPGAPGAHLFRRHPLTALAGLYALFSLAGVPGTPGAALWLEVARELLAHGRNGLLIALGLGWLAAFTTAVRELRDGFGAPMGARPERAVPWPVRWALWVSGAGLAAWGLARLAPH